MYVCHVHVFFIVYCDLHIENYRNVISDWLIGVRT